MLEEKGKKKLEEILKKYNQTSELGLERTIENVIAREIPSSEIDFYLMGAKNLDWDKAIEISLEIFSDVVLEEMEKTVEEEKEKKTPETGILEEIKNFPEEKPKEELINLGQLIEKINKEVGLSFPDDILAKRFETIILSYLKDIRDEISLKEILERPRKVGGTELSAEKVEQIIKILEEERPRVKLEIEIEREKPELAEGMKTPEELVAPTSAEIKPQEIVLPPAQEEIKPPVPVELFVLPEEKKEITKFQLGTLAPVLGVALKEEKEEEKINIPLPPSIEEHKIVGEKRGRMEEIKPRMRISGPIEELRFMTLEDWRRFGRPEAAVSKIEEKVNLLAEESLLKKAEAIKAWKQSEINQLYLEIGRESIDGGNASLNLIIEKRKNETRSFLTAEEFNAIAELNQRLRF